MMLSSRPGLLLAAGLAAFSFVGCGTSPAPTAGAPTITTQPAAATVVSGAAATLAVAATGHGTLPHQRPQDGTALPGGAPWGLALPAVPAANAGVYDCIVTNTLGSASQVAVSSG